MRCVWLDTPLAQAQVNLVERLLERFGHLPASEELRTLSRAEAGVLSPTQQMRAFRELEPPTADEGFAEVERIAFERTHGTGRPGLFVAAAAISGVVAGEPDAPTLVFDWRPDDDDEIDTTGLADRVTHLATAVCRHPGGAPICWCRPPLPGLLLEFARRHGVDPACSTLVGASPAHRTLANALGARYLKA